MPLAPSFVERLRRLDMAHDNVRHLVGHRHKVIGHRAVQEVGVVAEDTFLVEHGTDALDDGAAYLVVDDQRIDDAPAIGDRPIAQELDEAGVGSTSR